MPCVGSHGEVGNEGIFGFSATVRDDGRVRVGSGKAYGFEGFAQAADLVEFNQNRVCHTLGDALAQEVRVGDKEVVAYKLAAFADAVGELFPAVPVVFGASVFDGDDGVAVDKLFVVRRQLCRRQFIAAALFEDVEAGFRIIKFGGRDIERKVYVFARLVTGIGDGLLSGL